jgi:hypothetical protein
MQRSFAGTLLLALAVTALAACGSVAQAGDTSDTISIKFAADEPAGSFISKLLPSDNAGVPPYNSANWNNAGGQTDGTYSDPALNSLVRNTNGVATTTDASVTWSCNNTWTSRGRGENNDNFTFRGPDFWLMNGYLDSSDQGGGTFIDINITLMGTAAADMATGYSVVIYTLGGVPNRPAAYYVNDPTMANPKYVVPGGDMGQFNSGYHQAIGDDPDLGTSGSDHDFGNYVVFTGLSGDVAIHAEPQTFRAVINGVQIIKNP